ncbi:MAG: chitinase [Deltaproteobacteria bacterium]
MKSFLTAMVIVLVATFAGSAWGADISNPTRDIPAGWFVGPVIPDITANDSDVPIVVSPLDTVSIKLSIYPGILSGKNVDWWVGVQTPWNPPHHWVSYVYPEGWKDDIRRSFNGALFQIDGMQLYSMPLTVGQYVFYFCVSDPDGAPIGTWLGMDSVEVSVVEGYNAGDKASDELKKYLTEDDFKTLFPHAGEGKPFSIPDAADNLYSYENMLKGLDKKQEFAVFLSQGDDTTKRLELAAILANWAQETTGGWATASDGYTAYGLYYSEEVGVRGKEAPDWMSEEDRKAENERICASFRYYDASSDAARNYLPTEEPSCPPISNGCFFGRGPIQLSWNANYGRFSEFIYGDKMELLDDPDEIVKDGALAFASGFWFWTMYNDSEHIRNETCHNVMVDHGVKGFGRTLNIINGGIECNHKLPKMEYNKDIGQYNVDKTRRRADHFHRFADILGVGDQLPTRPEGYATNDEAWNTYYEEILEGCIEK